MAKKQRRSGYEAVRQTWLEPLDEPEPSSWPSMKSFARCGGCCSCSDAVSDGELCEEMSSSGEMELGGRKITSSDDGSATSDELIPPNFMLLGRDNPWLVCRSPDHGGKLFWLHRKTQETTWRQPLPRLAPLPKWTSVHAGMRDSCFSVVDAIFFGA